MAKQNLSPEAKAKQAAYYREWLAKNKDAAKEYHKGYYQENRERIIEQKSEYASTDAAKEKEKVRKARYESKGIVKDGTRMTSKIRRQDKRIELLNFLGGKCERCGNGDWRVLQVDHVNGGGSQERKTGYNLSAIRKDVFEHGRTKYQVLCANCHAIKIYEE